MGKSDLSWFSFFNSSLQNSLKCLYKIAKLNMKALINISYSEGKNWIWSLAFWFSLFFFACVSIEVLFLIIRLMMSLTKRLITSSTWSSSSVWYYQLLPDPDHSGLFRHRPWGPLLKWCYHNTTIARWSY